VSALRIPLRTIGTLIGSLLVLLGVAGLGLAYAPPTLMLLLQRGLELATDFLYQATGAVVTTRRIAEMIGVGLAPFLLLGGGITLLVLVSRFAGHAVAASN